MCLAKPKIKVARSSGPEHCSASRIILDAWHKIGLKYMSDSWSYLDWLSWRWLSSNYFYMISDLKLCITSSKYFSQLYIGWLLRVSGLVSRLIHVNLFFTLMEYSDICGTTYNSRTGCDTKVGGLQHGTQKLTIARSVSGRNHISQIHAVFFSG